MCFKTLLRAATVALVAFIAAAGADATEPCPDGLDLERVLAAHGAMALGDVVALDFTFHAMREGTEMIRQWHWDLRTNQVTLSTPADGGAMRLMAFESPPPAEASAEVHQADRQFLNDRFWLLFPHRLAWDEGVTVTVECTPTAGPVSGQDLPRFTATYGPVGGYTPGDAYDFWVLPDGRLADWAFRRGNAAEATIVVVFDDYVAAGPLTVSLTRNGADGQPRIWFTGVSAITATGVFEATPGP